MMQLRSFLFLIPLLTIACATPATTENADAPAVRGAPAGNRVELSAEPRGQSAVLLTLRNATGSPVGYNLCSSSLQRRAGTSWEAVPTDEMCTMEIRELEPGASATFEKTLPATAGRGEYRYVTTVDRPEGRLEVASNTFVVP